MAEFLQKFLESPDVVGYVVAAIVAGLMWVGRKVSHKWARDLIGRAAEALKVAVMSVHQTYTSERKKAKAAESPGGATITPEEAREAREKTLAAFGALFRWKRLLSLALWIAGYGKVEDWLEHTMEATVGATKPVISGNPIAPL